jgi:hypothetical protein
MVSAGFIFVCAAGDYDAFVANAVGDVKVDVDGTWVANGDGLSEGHATFCLYSCTSASTRQTHVELLDTTSICRMLPTSGPFFCVLSFLTTLLTV